MYEKTILKKNQIIIINKKKVEKWKILIIKKQRIAYMVNCF